MREGGRYIVEKGKQPKRVEWTREAGDAAPAVTAGGAKPAGEPKAAGGKETKQ